MRKKIQEMDERELIYTLLADKVGAVDPKDVFFAKLIDAGKNAGKYSVLLNGKKISSANLANLKAEAHTVESTHLWKIFTQTLAHDANIRMFKQAKTERDLDWGKAVLYSISIMETIVKAIQNAHIDEEPKPLSTPRPTG